MLRTNVTLMTQVSLTSFCPYMRNKYVFVSYSFILEKLCKLVSGLVTVGVALPVVRHVVDVR